MSSLAAVESLRPAPPPVQHADSRLPERDRLPNANDQAISIESESAFTNPECLIKAWWSSASVLEFPVPFPAREKGIAKGTRVPIILRSIRDILRWWFKWRVIAGQPLRDPGPICYWNTPARQPETRDASPAGQGAHTP